MHRDNKTGEITYYEVTGEGINTSNVHERTEEEFKNHYKERLDEDFSPTESSSGYDPQEIHGLNEEKLLEHIRQMQEKYKPGEEYYPYTPSTGDDGNVCTTFSYDAYSAGGIDFTPDPKDWFENPRIFPRDLNQAIEYHNSQRRGK